MNRESFKKFVPAGLRRLVSGNRNHSTRDRATEAELWERSRRRWQKAEPVTHLTWGMEVSGANFIAKANSYGAFGPNKALLEIGPGYGRLLKSILDQNLPFKTYLEIDLSEQNVIYLRKNLSTSRIDFVPGDIERVKLDRTFDTLFSSLTFKHLYPSFESALANAARHLNSDALVFFDLIEGSGKHFEADDVTYIRQYTKPEISQILDRTGLELIDWEEVHHTSQQSRLLVIARNAAAAHSS